MERLFFNRNVQTAFAVGQARGVVLLAAAQDGLPVREVAPHEVKMAVAGYGAADKEQVQRMVQVVLGMAVLPTTRRCGRRAGGRHLRRQQQVGQVARTSAASWTAPPSPRSTRGEIAYERAVREALAARSARSGRRSGPRMSPGRR